jgi:diguanylate cyclase (GGDEF)-like protein
MATSHRDSSPSPSARAPIALLRLARKSWLPLAAVAVMLGVVRARRRCERGETERRVLRASEESLRHQALHDALTSLPNRAGIIAEAAPGGSAALVVLDLDGFRQLNHTFGRAAGDAILVEVARRLRTVAPDEGLVGRIEGDKFAVLATGLGESEAARLAERLQAAVNAPVRLPLDTVRTTTTAGIAIASGDSADCDSLLRNADLALQEAKRGELRFYVYDAELERRIVDEAKLSEDLSVALHRGEFELHYQPIADLTSGQVVAVESLLRWRHPERGLLTPPQFMHSLERTGMVVPVGAWVLGEACRQCAEWRATVDGAHDLRVSVNLSARELEAGELCARVPAALAAHSLDPGALILELTESDVWRTAERNCSTLRCLAGTHIGLAIDDFGTGYSSLKRLRSLLPLDLIKIDRSFVAGLSAEADGRPSPDGAIVDAVVTLADALGTQVVAEGIEHDRQARDLAARGCRLGQGYGLARPAPAREVPALLAAPLRAPAIVPEAPVPDGPRVLVVDDHSGSREVITRVLESSGYRVAAACDGEEALAKLAAERFDLVLVDLLMPRVDGHEAALAVRRDQALRDVPVIAISAFVTGQYYDAGSVADFDGAVEKPIDVYKLVDQVAAWLVAGRG